MGKQENKTKIALVGYRLAHGGQERVLSTVSMLLDKADCDVHVLVLEDDIAYINGGKLVNFGLYSKYEKYFQLRKYLKTNQFDFVIDFRHRINPLMEIIFLNYIYHQFNSIYTTHTSILALHFTNNKWVAKEILKKVYKIVSVSSEMNEKIKRDYRFEDGYVIANCVAEETNNASVIEHRLPFEYIIAVGRLVAMKQFDKLIEIYCKSDLALNGIHLVILGEGEEKEQLKRQILNSGMYEYIHLLGFKENTSEFVKNAKFLVLTSQYEGFPMVILEALYDGIPVISFDCETGPSEMIVDECNGILVENQNFIALKTAINRLISDKQLYDFCKDNAKSSVDKFSAENIQKKWLDLLNINTN